MRVGDIVKYDDWIGIVTAVSGPDLEEGEEVEVQWSKNNGYPMREPICLLEVLSESR